MAVKRASTARPVRFRLGAARVGKGTRASTAAGTREARKQMEAVERRFAHVLSTIRDAAPDAIEFALDPIYAAAIEYVPRDTGALEQSGYISVVPSRQGAQGEVGFGRGGVPEYTVLVHENLEFYHEPPTQAKFLERAIEEHVDEVPGRLIEFLRLP